MRRLLAKDFECIAVALMALTGIRWKVRKQCMLVARLPSGRLFFVTRDWFAWTAFTGVSIARDWTEDLRCSGSSRDVSLRPNERQEEVDALVIGALYERALADPLNATRRWPSMKDRPDLYHSIKRKREQWAAEDLAEAIAARYT